MSPRAATGRLAAGRDLLLALTALLTTWTAVLAWRGFTDNPGRFLEPLLVIGLVTALTGCAARALGSPVALAAVLQVVVGAVATLHEVTGSWLPGPASVAAARDALALSVDSASQYAAPVPGDVPPVEPLLLVSGLACVLLVDVVACSLRRVSLTGLPLLTIYTLPVSMLGGTVSWWVFTLPAIGFIAMLYQHTAADLDRWDRSDVDAGSTGHPGPLARGGTADAPPRGGARAAALAIGTVATGLALVLPVAVPTLGLSVFDGPGGGDGDQEISLDNPMTDMRRDLQRPDDTPLLRVTTTDANPSYLRISVLSRFSEDAWTSGDRDLPDDQVADGPLPEPEGVAGSVPRRTTDWEVDVSDEFASTWLPTPFPAASIEAEGAWKYDRATRDFIAAEDNLTTAGLRYRVTALDLDLSAEQLASSSPGAAAVGEEFTELPAGLPEVVGDRAREVTAGRDNDFARAVALQDWFRRDGGFTYSLEAAGGNGANTLARFLDADDPDGRIGYCEQFASAMAVMARELDMPARVAVGFLRPELLDQSETSLWEYSSDDLHAWPEIYFPGAGWVRFEPTPAMRASDVPPYTRGLEAPGDQPAPAPEPNPGEQQDPGGEVPEGLDAGDQGPVVTAGVATAGAGPWWRTALVLVLGVLLPVAVLAGLLVGPMLLRRARGARRRRTSAPVEAAWAELADTVVDLGGTWPSGRSPAQARAALLPLLAPAPGDLAARAADALDRLVGALELHRYARDGSGGATGPGHDPEGDAETVVAALVAVSGRRQRVLATWLPRSLVVRRARGEDRTAPGGMADGTRTVVETLG